MWKLEDLETKSILILGLGVEGLSTLKFLRELFPEKTLGIADVGPLELLDAEARRVIEASPRLEPHFGENYLGFLEPYDLIIKTPGISIVRHPEIQRALVADKLTSHTALFFANCPGTIIGVTGTKGKGTTSKLIHSMLKAGGLDAYLVGNIGNPPLPLLRQAGESSIFVFELSAQQLETLRQSPHIAVLLNIVPDHLDHFASFENYVQAKQNLARHQTERDYLVYNPAFPAPRRIADEARSELIPCAIEGPLARGCFVDERQVICRLRDAADSVALDEVSAVLPGSFNLYNVVPAVAVAKLVGLGNGQIIEGIRNFEPEEHRFERVGSFRGITFYNASIATVPEVTIEHLKSLGDDVQTMLLGGFDRGMAFGTLAERIVQSKVRTVILFPETGRRIWEAISAWAVGTSSELPQHFFIDGSAGAESAMREAVRLSYLHTGEGKICLHSPASPSFGVFKNYKERGQLFKRFVRELGE
ncbi:MAG TPA: UDP-N-acetylmuramoyl-L-alanine--D-glutamate ligase [Blastocatellia bacterium]|nr:UDP-N-acetylmuramoyl-L-alanine--D-glutamate ligase [Blastocatellia bacterium]